ncbi:SDR family NAD(P)-dependent oxidoreductase [Pelagibius sp. 7325]|uniref:SDR family NAD(P)-dependent oxidoreductase n=1 Tax=Pelagibius sp. 7325 TaxID=3131994 RepID=UPI0030EB5D36
MTVALVTGVVGGIGAAIARRLAADGFRVAVCDRPGADFDKAAAALGMPAYAADLGRRAEVERLAAAIANAEGAPEVLVNCAGGVCGQVHRPVDEVPEEDWRAVFAANTDSAFFLAQALAPAMRARRRGRIVTISSGAGLRPSLTGIQAYTAAKHALVGLTKQLALELGPHGVTVNSVAPGFVLSNEATRRQWESYGEAGQRALVERIHLRRLGRPEDIANAVAFLVGADAAWITGQVLSVDGGHA